MKLQQMTSMVMKVLASGIKHTKKIIPSEVNNIDENTEPVTNHVSEANTSEASTRPPPTPPPLPLTPVPVFRRAPVIRFVKRVKEEPRYVFFNFRTEKTF